MTFSTLIYHGDGFLLDRRNQKIDLLISNMYMLILATLRLCRLKKKVLAMVTIFVVFLTIQPFLQMQKIAIELEK